MKNLAIALALSCGGLAFADEPCCGEGCNEVATVEVPVCDDESSANVDSPEHNGCGCGKGNK